MRLVAELKARIESAELKAGDRLPGRSALAERYRVSQMTVSNAISELAARGYVRTKAKSGVFVSDIWRQGAPASSSEAVRPPGSIAKTTRVRQQTVALIFGDPMDHVMSTPYPRTVLDGCRAYALEHNMRCLAFCGLPESEEEANGNPAFHDLLNALRGQEIDGIICAYGSAPAQLSWLGAQGLPVVNVEQCPASLQISPFACVRLDRREIVRMGVDALAQQSCRHLGLISNYRSADAQNDGGCPYAIFFREALAERGFPCNPDWIWDPRDYMRTGARYTVSGHEAEGYQALSDLWRTPNSDGRRVDGIVVTDDFMTRGCLFAALNLGLKIGEDVMIATHANRGSDSLQRFEHSLSLMEVDASNQASVLIKTLELMMSGKPYEAERLVKPRLKMPAGDQSQFDYRTARAPSKALR